MALSSTLEHVGITVPDLDDAVSFFGNVLGWQELFRSPVYDDGDYLARTLDVDRSSSLQFAMLDAGNDTFVEVFEYTVGDQATVGPRNSDIGGGHLALRVDDVDAAIAAIAERGDIRVLEGPNINEIAKWIYFVTPWGLYIELLERLRPLTLDESNDLQ
jgi:catechol 2,3-dioxygenase-like lactoylglutathione lyase family enzyme